MKDEIEQDELDQLEDESEGYCWACETNPAKLERALEGAEEMPARWRTMAEGFRPDSATALVLRACAKELEAALKGGT